jgi:tetratricopeptide (TPR) repeat protein
MHKSHTGLREWFSAIYLFTRDKRGISAAQLARTIGISNYAALLMLQKLKKAMEDREAKYYLDGILKDEETGLNPPNLNPLNMEEPKDALAAVSPESVADLAPPPQKAELRDACKTDFFDYKHGHSRLAALKEPEDDRFGDGVSDAGRDEYFSSPRNAAGFREKYGRFAAACVIMLVIGGTIFLTYSHLRRNSYGYLMENAEALYNREMYEASLKAYREVSLLYPDRIDPFLGVARVSEQMGQVEEAIEAYKCVLDLEPFFDFAQDELVRVSRMFEDGDEEEVREAQTVPAGGRALQTEQSGYVGVVNDPF